MKQIEPIVLFECAVEKLGTVLTAELHFVIQSFKIDPIEPAYLREVRDERPVTVDVLVQPHGLYVHNIVLLQPLVLWDRGCSTSYSAESEGPCDQIIDAVWARLTVQGVVL